MHTHTDIAERLQESFLHRAEHEGRCLPQRTELHTVDVSIDNSTRYRVVQDELLHADRDDFGMSQATNKEEANPRSSFVPPDDGCFKLQCLLQRSRPPHVSGRSDPLPFKSVDVMRQLFHLMHLPATYFQIADGSPATVYSYISSNLDGRASKYELIAHILTKQGNWAMALSHDASLRTTSAFWSVDARIDSTALSEDLLALQEYAFHPMLVPCIMLSATLRMAIQRRHSIKERLDWIEKRVGRISASMAVSSKLHESAPEYAYNTNNIEDLFGLLSSCKKDQESRKGQYEFWNSFNEAIEEGFNYAESILDLTENESRQEGHCDLRKWKALTWQRIRSIMARDEDHNSRVDNVSYTVYTLNQQRDIRLQSQIAQAAQLDSEDMKFIAVLGSIFLPASLVATILNVPEFQFLPGAQLFGAYIAISLPLIGVVVLLCFARKYRHLWTIQSLRAKRVNAGVVSASTVSDHRSPASELQRQFSQL